MTEKNKYKIYSIKNKNNGKEYIGLTKYFATKRFAEHISTAFVYYENKRNDFYLDIYNSGEDVFNVFNCEILEVLENVTKETAKYIESEYIKKRESEYNEKHKTKFFSNVYSDEIIEKYKQGETMGALRAEYQCRQQVIRGIIDNNNIERHSGTPWNTKPIYEFSTHGIFKRKWNSAKEFADNHNSTASAAQKCSQENAKYGILWYKSSGKYLTYNKEIKHVYQLINAKTKEESLFYTKEAALQYVKNNTKYSPLYGDLNRRGVDKVCGFYKKNLAEEMYPDLIRR